MYTSFDDLQEQNPVWQKPFFAIDHENEAVVFEWLKTEFTRLKGNSWSRHEKIKNMYLRYKGIQYEAQYYDRRKGDNQPKSTYRPSLVYPLIRDMIDERVARLLEKKPGISVLPVHDEEGDKVDAKIAKRFLSSIDNTEGLEMKFNKVLKNAKIAGESFLYIPWNPDKGPIHPSFQHGMVMPDGKVMKDGVQIGDVDIKPVSALHVFYEEAPSRLWEDVNYLFYVEAPYTEQLKRDFPKKEGLITQDVNGTIFYDFENMEEVSLFGRTTKVTFWHKKTKYLPEGFEASFTLTTLLKMGATPYKDDYHQGIPFVRFLGTENEEELHGESVIEPVRGIASQVSNQVNMTIKQFMLCAYPKWFVDGNSVDEQQLGNDTSIVRVKGGAKPPVLAQANPVSAQMLDFTDKLIDKFYSFSKSNSVVQGEPPTGVTAFVALQYVSESENRRLSTEVSSLNDSILHTYEMILRVCGQMYKKDDGRTLRIIGKDNQWLAMKYDPESLTKPYNIVFQNQTALPESRANKTQMVLDIATQFPDLFPKEQVLEMLGLAQSEKVLDVGSAAARAAEDENEWILDGKGEIDPQEYEDLITHWRVHIMAVQDIAFKMKVDKKIQEDFKAHILATEMLMIDQAQKSDTFAQLLMQLPQFPMFYEIPKTPQVTPEAAPPEQIQQ